MKCDTHQPLRFAREWMQMVETEGHSDTSLRFLQLARRLKDKLGGHLSKAAAGACLIIAVKVETGVCPPLQTLSSTLGVSSRALVAWEAKTLKMLDWNLELTREGGDGADEEDRRASTLLNWTEVAEDLGCDFTMTNDALHSHEQHA